MDIWDAYTDLSYEDMAEIASEALDLKICQVKDLSKKEKAMIDESWLDHGDAWVIFDDEPEVDFDLMYMISDYEDEIVDYIEDDKEILKRLVHGNLSY